MAIKAWKGLKSAFAEGCDRISGWLAKLRSDCPELKLLVIGETGVGKSTLINNLLGEEVASEGHNVESATSAVRCYIGEIEGVPVKLYDTPGLGDSRSERDDEYLKEIRKLIETETIHLIIYCFKMTETRMRRSLIRTFEQYTKIGVDWRKSAIALTHADSLQLPPKLKKQKGYSKSTYFKERLADWRKKIPRTLASEIGLEETTVARISINPTTGDYDELLPNGEDWYIPFWLDVLDVLPPAARIRFIDIHKNNIVYGDKETRDKIVWPKDLEIPPPPPIPEEPKVDKEGREAPQELGDYSIQPTPKLTESRPPPCKPSMEPNTLTPVQATTGAPPEGPSGVNISISNQAPVNVNPSISIQSNPSVSTQNNPAVFMPKEWPDDLELPPPMPIPEEPKVDKEGKEAPQEFGNYSSPPTPKLTESSPPSCKPSKQPNKLTPVQAGTGAHASPEGPSGVNVSISNQAPVNVNPSISIQSNPSVSAQNNPAVSLQNPCLESSRDSDSDRVTKPVIKLEGERRERFEKSVGEAVETAAGMAVGGMAAGSVATIATASAAAVGLVAAPVVLPVAAVGVAVGTIGAGVGKLFGWW